MRCLWYGVLENLKRIPKVPGSRPFSEKSAVRIDDNGLRIFYKKDTLILLFTIVIIILNMFNIGNTQNLTWAAIISFIKGKKNDIFCAEKWHISRIYDRNGIQYGKKREGEAFW